MRTDPGPSAQLPDQHVALLDLHIGINVDDIAMDTTPLNALVRKSDLVTGTVVLPGAGYSPELNARSLDDLASGHGPHSELNGSM